MPKSLKPEALFEANLGKIAPFYDCQYIKIKDTRLITANNRSSHREVKRICDAIIITKSNNWFCECKMDSAQLLPHQEQLRNLSYEYNGFFVVLRKQKRKSGWIYRIITKWGEWKTDQIKDIFILLSKLPNNV